MSKQVFLKDFSEDTQQFLKQFGITEDLDIKADFEEYLNKNNINITKKLNELGDYFKCLEQTEKLEYYKNHKKNIFLGKNINSKSSNYSQEIKYSLAS